MHELTVFLGVIGLFILLSATMVLHYVTKWKTTPSLTSGDEAMLEELYLLARRLDERMDTVEKLVAAEHPEFTPGVPLPDRDADNQILREIESLRAAKQGKHP